MSCTCKCRKILLPDYGNNHLLNCLYNPYRIDEHMGALQSEIYNTELEYAVRTNHAGNDTNMMQ